jgi:DNA-binding MarR family transcriptional regulator
LRHVRRRLDDAIRAAGFDDLQDAHLPVFQYPPPNAVRPSVLARELQMSRQAANYLIAQLEELGYLERREGPEGGRRLVYLTERGWRVADTIFATLRAIHEEWVERVGRGRFEEFLAVLRLIAAEERPLRPAVDPARFERAPRPAARARSRG